MDVMVGDNVLATTTFTDAASSSYDFYGFRTSPSLGWEKGNLGTIWAEGEWVPYQFVLGKAQNDFPGLVDLPDAIREVTGRTLLRGKLVVYVFSVEGIKTVLP